MHCSANLQVFDFTLEPEEISQVTALHRGWRYIVPTITVSYITIKRQHSTTFYSNKKVTSKVNLMLNLLHLRLCQIKGTPTLCMFYPVFKLN